MNPFGRFRRSWRAASVRARMPSEFEPLARYNAEVARGIEHSPEWRSHMAELQSRFDRRARSLRGPAASPAS